MGADAEERIPFHIPVGCEEELLTAPDGSVAGALRRSWAALEGEVEIQSARLAPAPGFPEGLFRFTVGVVNTSPWNGTEREPALRHTLVATHALLQVEGGEFLSLTDPPAEAAGVAAGCENVGLWPVLVGAPRERQTLLAAPIILPDYPQIAPESPGGFFDGTEIDQMLVLNVLTLTEAEKAEMRASDARTREILARSEALTTDDFMKLHGAIRDFRVLREEPAADPFAALERPAPESVVVGGVPLRKGSRVRLQPRAGRDLMDMVLAGKTAVVEAIEQDYEERIHLAVSVEDDPGRDLGAASVLGHRFFFAPEEVVALE